MEGGTYDVAVASNVEALREAFNRFFSRFLGREDLSVEIEMGAGYKNAVKTYLKDTGQYLWVDSDDLDTAKWYERLENDEKPIMIALDDRKHIYFMIQEMEAWFLKQPDCFDRWAEAEGYIRVKGDTLIKDDNTIAGKNIEALQKPSDIVDTIIQRYFERIDAKGRQRKVKYGKLKSAPGLIDNLDARSLEEVDAQLARFHNEIP